MSIGNCVAISTLLKKLFRIERIAFSCDDLNLLSFLSAIVRPSKPVVGVTESLNSVSWVLPEGGEDERPDSFTVNLYFAHNSSLAQRFSGVAADVRQASLSVVPGMNYSVTVIAHNQDGTTPSESHQFSTPPGRKRSLQCIKLYKFM